MAALLTAPLMALLLATTASAQAGPEPSPPDPRLTVTDVSLNRTAVAVSGLNTAPVGVRVKGGFTSADPLDANIPLVAHLQRTSGTGSLTYLVSADLPRVSGTTQNGEWAGVVNVPSTADGTFKVIGVTTGPYSMTVYGTEVGPTPFNGPALAVTGYHRPKITASVSPRLVPFGSGYSITWTVTDSATGKPYASRITVMLGVDSQCVESLTGEFLRTSSSGTVTKAYPASAAAGVNCLRIAGKPLDIAGLGVVVTRPGIVSAAPSATSAKVGTIVPVNGNVLGSPAGCKVLLQRLYGATQWRAVSTAAVRQSGRFTVSAQPAYNGLIPYRVYFPTCYNFHSGVSKVFYIRGL
ncbi:hypothetical protein [Kribbella shirazensis]|uniref:Carboxypeptidase regulatory-like domain-containing protein n=1 Tax=Kribbella shirazensis TaxID=1105143 RepID=A0A7X6A4I9_9ACTN|nr:hypothetical protein [Kribbella shirazensis]NIK61562.1 hypothetical protein [Kribbella shirazensis]